MLDESIFLDLVDEIVEIPQDDKTSSHLQNILKEYSNKLYTRKTPPIHLHKGPKKLISKDLYIHGSFLLDFYNFILKVHPGKGNPILQKLLTKSISTILDIQILLNRDRIDSCFILLRNLYENSKIGTFLCLNMDLIEKYKKHTIKDIVKSLEIQKLPIPENIQEDFDNLKTKENYGWAYPTINSKNITLKDIVNYIEDHFNESNDYTSLYNMCNQFVHSSSFSIFALDSITPFMLQDYFIMSGCKIASEFLYMYLDSLNIDDIYLEIFNKINFSLYEKYNENLFM